LNQTLNEKKGDAREGERIQRKKLAICDNETLRKIANTREKLFGFLGDKENMVHPWGLRAYCQGKKGPQRRIRASKGVERTVHRAGTRSPDARKKTKRAAAGRNQKRKLTHHKERGEIMRCTFLRKKGRAYTHGKAIPERRIRGDRRGKTFDLL